MLDRRTFESPVVRSARCSVAGDPNTNNPTFAVHLDYFEGQRPAFKKRADDSLKDEVAAQPKHLESLAAFPLPLRGHYALSLLSFGRDEPARTGDPPGLPGSRDRCRRPGRLPAFSRGLGRRPRGIHGLPCLLGRRDPNAMAEGIPPGSDSRAPRAQARFSERIERDSSGQRVPDINPRHKKGEDDCGRAGHALPCRPPCRSPHPRDDPRRA